jgi:hypothetical protein
MVEWTRKKVIGVVVAAVLVTMTFAVPGIWLRIIGFNVTPPPVNYVALTGTTYDPLAKANVVSVDVYVYNPVTGAFIQKVTSDGTSAIFTTSQYLVGTVLMLQLIKSGYYTTPAFLVQIPVDVPVTHTTWDMGNTPIRKVTSSVTLTSQDQTGAAIADSGSYAYVTKGTTFTWSFLASALTANTYYGSEAYVDLRYGYSYAPGIVGVLRTNSTEVIVSAGYSAMVPSGSYIYYIYYFSSFYSETGNPAVGTESWSVQMVCSGTSPYIAQFCIYDGLRVDYIAALAFGSADADITAVTLVHS